MKVPLLDLQAQYAPLHAPLLAAITRACDTPRFIGGPEVEALERRLPFHLQDRFAPLGYARGACPHAEAAAHESLAPPISGELTGDQLRYVVDAVVEYVR